MTFRTYLNPRHALGLAAAVAVAGCTSGNSAIEPPFQSNNISTQGKLQFAVGTANIATSSGTPVIGFNTVETFRQANGASAFAVDLPSIVGPAGFTVPASATSAGADAGTNTIGVNTFGTSGQATLYGFGPNNYDTSGNANFGNYALPFYCEVLGLDSNSLCTYPSVPLGGFPPAFPASSIGGFAGYNPGFVYFPVTPVSGTYALNVLVQTSPGSSQQSFTYHALATLNAAKVLPALTAPTFTDDGKGGGTLLVPAFPAGVVSELIELSSSGGSPLATYNVTAPGTVVVADGSLTSTSSYLFTTVGFDYNWFAPAAPANTQQTPALPLQADITVAPPLGITALSNGRRTTIHPATATSQRRH